MTKTGIEAGANERIEAGSRVRVLLPLAIPLVLDYLAGDDPLMPGQFVWVTLSGKKRVGVVWGPSQETSPAVAKLKVVGPLLQVPALSPEHCDFIDWVANYTLANPGAVLRMTMNTPDALVAPPTGTRYIRGGDDPAKMTHEREALLEKLVDQMPRSVKELSLLGGVGEGVVRGLIKLGTLTGVEINLERPCKTPDPSHFRPQLSHEQQVAADFITLAVQNRSFGPILLDGVTGSGKTEVYFEAIAAALAAGSDAQILVLLPEIALTSQWLGRFEARFGVAPVEWHSDLSGAERRRSWRAVHEGRARVVVGARSALFLPFEALALIIVDEEHDPSFKQEEGVIYHARDMAVVRAKLAQVPIILASATPSFETYVNAIEGKYAHLILKERHGVAKLPRIEAIDLRIDPPPAGRWIAPPLEAAMSETLGRGEQVMLFLNRRGYAPLTLCRHCGERIDCPNCSAWLVEHRTRAGLECHHCGHHLNKPETCPECGEVDSLAACGPGVERIEEEVVALFPKAKVMVMTSDTATGPKIVAGLVSRIHSGEVDIVIGTQIITKGYHFPGMTLVGVVDADLGLKGADLRAAERSYQQLTQVAGRAGREEKEGLVLLQTYMPDHPVAAALLAGDVDAFRTHELEARKNAVVPPFGRMAGLILSCTNEREAFAAARHLAAGAPKGHNNLMILGPAPAPLFRLRGMYRYRLLVMAPSGFPLQQMIRKWVHKAGKLGEARLRIDIDPQSFQ
jgi:primosomal protein N' (replication factor Y) (superfamily II helicase)